ncbi:hypothetical protein CBL_02841 [Carabus blaptoides fortunei]
MRKKFHNSLTNMLGKPGLSSALRVVSLALSHSEADWWDLSPRDVVIVADHLPPSLSPVRCKVINSARWAAGVRAAMQSEAGYDRYLYECGRVIRGKRTGAEVTSAATSSTDTGQDTVYY